MLFFAGIVLSVAPLMGADPAIDDGHKRWLHVHVRPPVRGLLKACFFLSTCSFHKLLVGLAEAAHPRRRGGGASRVLP